MRGYRHFGGFGLILTFLAVLLLATNCGKSHSGGSGPLPCGPTIDQIAPDTGDVAGNETVVIFTSCFQDDFLLDLPQVTFGGVPALSITPVTAETLSVVTPPHATPEAVDVVVAGTGVLESGTKVLGFTYAVAPCTVSSVVPATGSTLGGQMVTVNGTNFDQAPLPVPTVEFGLGNLSPNVTVMTPTQLLVETPAAVAAGQVDVIVTVQSGPCTRANGYEYFTSSPCTVTFSAPSQGFMDQLTSVTLTGTNFDQLPLPTPTVEFGLGNFGTNVAVVTPDTLLVTAPMAAAASIVDVIVTNQSGPCTLPGGFEYLPSLQPACTVTSVAPRSGPDFGNTDIAIYGTGFTQVARVWLGAVEVIPIRFMSDTEIQITTPPGTGTVGVTVDIGGGTTCSLPSAYSYVTCGAQTCTLSRVQPSRGDVGEQVTIVGDAFESGAQVFFGNAPAVAQAVVVDESGLPTDLVVIVPSRMGPASDVDVQVINPSGSCCIRAGAFTYGGCFIESVTPDMGLPDGGVRVMIRGEGFTAPPVVLPEVWFGTELSPFVLPWSATELIAETPPSAGQTAVDVTVIWDSGEICSFCCYTYYAGCVIDSIVPSSGGTNGGDTLTIIGSGFDTQKLPPFNVNPSIRFGGIYVDDAFVGLDPTGTLITLVAPPSFTGGPHDVEITNLMFGTTCVGVGAYDYILPGTSACTITDVNPSSGSMDGGTSVTIRGDGFDSATGVIFGLAPAPQVTFISPTELRVTTPEPRGQDLSLGMAVVDVFVSPLGSDPCMLPGAFTYMPPPCQGQCGIVSIAADNGPVSGGNAVTINGYGFCDRSPEIYFDVVPSPSVTYIDATTLSAVVPPSATGPGTIGVVYIDGTGCASGCGVCYTYN